MENSNAIRNRYLSDDKSFNIRNHLKNLQKEESSNLKGIEIRSTTKSLGKNDFLKLLITQLSSQDPTNPVKDQAFIAQMAQFSSLEQMKNVAKGMEKMQSKQNFNLVGKIVSGPDFVSGEDISGVVGAIIYDSSGKAFARIKGRTIDVDQINLISDPKVLNDQKQQNISNQQQSFESRAKQSETLENQPILNNINQENKN